MPKNRLILWDIDGTLMNCGSDGRKALNRTFAELYHIHDAFEQADIGGAMDFMIIHGIMETFQISRQDFDRISSHYSCVLAEILHHDKEKQILPGVIPLLDAIEGHPNSMNALLTSNLKLGARAKLDSVGLWDYFKIGGFGDEPGEKWHAAERCIKLAQDLHGAVFSNQEIYLIGDSIYDMYCAKKLGIRSVAVATGWGEEEALLAYEPDYFFNNLSETDQVLRALCT